MLITDQVQKDFNRLGGLECKTWPGPKFYTWDTK